MGGEGVRVVGSKGVRGRVECGGGGGGGGGERGWGEGEGGVPPHQVTWKARKRDVSNAGYSKEVLQTLFSEASTPFSSPHSPQPTPLPLPPPSAADTPAPSLPPSLSLTHLPPSHPTCSLALFKMS